MDSSRTEGQQSASALQTRLLQQETLARETLSPWKMARRRFLRHRLALVSLAFFVVLVLTIYIWSALMPPTAATATDINYIQQPPSLKHPFGTDNAGSDVLVRVVLGGRVSITVGLLAAAISVTIGTLVGSVSGFYGGILDNILMRIVDMMLSIPLLFLVIILAALLGAGIRTVIIVIGIATWMDVSRIIRANFLSLKQKEFVEAARSIGARDVSLIFRHILPNTIAPIIVAATLNVANAILLEAYVSFLGYGIQPPQPSWGNMVSSGSFLLTISQAPWMMLFPGLMITLTVLAVNFIGDGLRDALDPHAVI